MPKRTSGLGGTSVSAEARPTPAIAMTASARAAARLSTSQDIDHPPRLDSERLGIGRATLADHRNLHQLRLLPGSKHGLADNGAGGDQAGANQRQRYVDEGPRPPGDAADQVGHLVVAEGFGAGELVALALAFAQGGDDAASGVLGPDRLETSLSVARDRQHRQEGEAAQQGYPGIRVVV